MEAKNKTAISEFFLLGLMDNLELQPLIFSLFLSMYLVTIQGNLLMILAVSFDSHLHTPMYFFLYSLSLNDICLNTTTAPKMLVSIQTQDHSITQRGCLAQIYLVLVFSGLETCLLAAMVYDRYVAICHPLRYAVILNICMCVSLTLFFLFISITDGVLHSLMMLSLSFCTELRIPHFFCEFAQVIRLTCSDTLVGNIVIYIEVCILGGVPAFGIILSYIHIVSSILRMPSPEGKFKAFSTCGSHLSVVTLLYGTGFGVYISSAVTDSMQKVAMASVMYSAVSQMVNPFIYSLRKSDMRAALWKLIARIASLL
ncbi:olfactory receptor 7G2 [Fukomys damarensis]|uniref:Olfactory receptor 7G2 n=1 Tax=Fukomys damarensis TaxID=885580 RepID=A0A091DJN4_FUKDA|nr:olfactory receptor 7G2 [Fukomys damarensis]KFO30500.1 Olfactory receptor 7G2 [Fukomys damarensis]